MIVVIGIVFTPIIARTVRSTVLQRARARLRLRSPAAGRAARRTSCSPRSSRTCSRRSSSSSPCGSATRSSPSRRSRSSASASSRRRPTGASQIAENYGLISRRHLVADALPRARDRDARRRRQPRSPTGSRRWSTDERDDAANALDVVDLDVAYRDPRTRPPGAARALVPRSRRARVTASSASPAAGSRRSPSPSSATWRATGASARAASASTGATCSTMSTRRPARAALDERLDGLPGSRPRAQPLDPGREAARGGLRDRGASAGEPATAQRGDAPQGADRRPGLGACSATRTSCRAACSSAS